MKLQIIAIAFATLLSSLTLGHAQSAYDTGAFVVGQTYHERTGFCNQLSDPREVIALHQKDGYDAAFNLSEEKMEAGLCTATSDTDIQFTVVRFIESHMVSFPTKNPMINQIMTYHIMEITIDGRSVFTMTDLPVIPVK